MTAGVNVNPGRRVSGLILTGRAAGGPYTNPRRRNPKPAAAKQVMPQLPASTSSSDPPLILDHSRPESIDGLSCQKK